MEHLKTRYKPLDSIKKQKKKVHKSHATCAFVRLAKSCTTPSSTRAQGAHLLQLALPWVASGTSPHCALHLGVCLGAPFTTLNSAIICNIWTIRNNYNFELSCHNGCSISSFHLYPDPMKNGITPHWLVENDFVLVCGKCYDGILTNRSYINTIYIIIKSDHLTWCPWTSFSHFARWPSLLARSSRFCHPKRKK